MVVVEVGACWSFSGSAGAAAGAKLRAAGGGALGFLPPHMVRTSENEEETQEHEDSPLLDGEEAPRWLSAPDSCLARKSIEC